MKSTLLTVPPEVDAVHVTGPLSVAPFARLEVTVSGGGGGGGGALEFETVTELDTVADRPSVEYAFTDSVCGPLLSVVVSS